MPCKSHSTLALREPVPRSNGLGLLELSALGSDVWLGVGVWDTWGWSEMLLGLSILGSSEEESIGS
jgi:hypothetical protein